MSIDDLPESLQQLDHIPIERLGLSDKAFSVLKWHGITSILTCVLFFYYDAHHTSHDWSKLVAFMYDEVEPKMKIHGYWTFLEDAEVWRVLKQQDLHIGESMVVFWQGKDQDLYDIPLEVLGLTDAAVQAVKWFGLLSVADCIEHFISSFNNYPKTQLGMEHLRDSAGLEPEYIDFNRHMFEELQPRLMELGYWRFVEDHVD